MFLVLPFILLFAIIPQFLLGLRVSYKYDKLTIDTDTFNGLIRSVTEEKKDFEEESRQLLTQNSAVLPVWFKEYVLLHRNMILLTKIRLS